MGLYGITIYWFTEFNFIGGVLSMMAEAAFLSLGALVTPSGRGRRAGWVGALVLQDWVRTFIPFGGVPLGGIPLGQADGPLAPAARVGGQLLLTGVTAMAAVALEAAVVAGVRVLRTRRARAPLGAEPAAADGRARRGWVGALFPVAAAVGAVALSLAGTMASSGHAVGPIRVALVQGGGRRGLHAIDNPPELVLQRQLNASALIRGPVDLIVWPEDVVALDGPVLGSPQAAEVAAVAVRNHAPLLAGVTEDVSADKFRNAEVLWDDTGRITGRYDKVHRVPFGEYIPGRSFIKHIVNLNVIPRDAIAGHGTGELTTPAGPVGIVISFEVFFSARARSAINGGGQVLLVPTNTASYRNTQVPAAEIAAERIRAWETGRNVLMVAPTGFSTVVDSRGRLLQRTHLGSQQVLEATVERRTGKTPYLRWGDVPALVLAWALLGGGVAASLLDRTVNSGKP
jgi:apolipoprotein N-acyltransferase